MKTNRRLAAGLVLGGMLLIGALLPLPASAQTNVQTSEPMMCAEEVSYERAVDLAIMAFPDYGHEIRYGAYDEVGLSTRGASNNVVATAIETRFLGDDISVTYAEYSDGTVFALTNFVAGKNTTSTVTSGSYTTYTLNAWLTAGGSEDILMVDGIKCKVNNSTGANSITNYGSISAANSATGVTRTATKGSGTKSSPASR